MVAYLVYDGDCGMCSFAQRFVSALDRRGRIEAVPMNDPRTASLLAELDEAARWSTFHVVRDGKTTGGGDGILEVGGLLFGEGIPNLAVEMPILRRWSARAYSFLAHLRGAVQCET